MAKFKVGDKISRILDGERADAIVKSYESSTSAWMDLEWIGPDLNLSYGRDWHEDYFSLVSPPEATPEEVQKALMKIKELAND